MAMVFPACFNFPPPQMQHPAQPSATYAEQQAYHLGVPEFSGPIDQWLITNSHAPQINHLSNYFLLRDPSSKYVTCTVECHYETVSNLLFKSLSAVAELCCN